MKETFSSHFCLGSGGCTDTPSSAPLQRCCLCSVWGAGWESCGVEVGGAGAPLPVPCLSQAWAGPPRGSFLVSSVVTSPAEEAPGVPDTQSTTLRTNLEMEKQIKLK